MSTDELAQKLEQLSGDARIYYSRLTNDFQVIGLCGEEELYAAGLVERTWKRIDPKNPNSKTILMSRKKTYITDQVKE